jgi:hypothetical protein
MPRDPATILELQKTLFSKVDQRIILKIHANTLLVASNITPTTFKKLSFIVNDPKFSNSLYFKNISAYIEEDLKPTVVYGLAEIVEGNYTQSDAIAFVKGDTTHSPFSDDFQDGLGINALVTTLCGFSDDLPDLMHFKTTPDDISTSAITLAKIAQAFNPVSAKSSTSICCNNYPVFIKYELTIGVNRSEILE